MRKISGFVVVKETGTPVPNLEVVAYETESPAKASAGRTRSAEIARLFGQQIASVLTDADGKFSLNVEVSTRAADDHRQELVIAVFAPEDVRDIDHPLPLSRQQRLVFITSRPLTDSSAEDAYPVRILQAQIEKFAIPIGAAKKEGTAAGNRYADRVQHTLAFRESVKSAMKKHIQTQVDARSKRHKAAQIFVKSLHGIPRHLRDDHKTGKKNSLQNNDFVITHRADLPEKLASLQQKAASDGLARMANRKSKPSLRLHVTRKQLKTLGLDEEKGKVTGEISPRGLATLLSSAAKGIGLIKVRGINNPSPDELERRYLTPATPPATKKTKSDSRKAKPDRKTKAPLQRALVVRRK